MRSSKPPALATWMLQHLALGRDSEVLAGDLLEEFKRRGSVGWYWRQVLAAILVGFTKELRAQWQAAGFAVIWTIVASTLLRHLYHNSQYRSALGWAISHEWPESSVYFTSIEVAPQLLTVWAGLSLYLAMMRRLSARRVVRGLLICSFFSLLELGFYAMWVPAHRPPRLLVPIVRLMPSFVALLLSLWATLPSSAMRRSARIPLSNISD